MKVPNEEYVQIRKYINASRELYGWISGARVLALLNGALDSGVLLALQTKSTPEEIAAATDIDQQTVENLCLALKEHRMVEQDGDHFQLTPDYALLASPTAPIPLEKLLGQTDVWIRALQNIPPSSTYTGMPSEDVLAMAEGAGISALSSAPHVSQEVVGQAFPEVKALWQAGAHHLEVGCGVGNALFGIVLTYPQVTAVGIEIDELTAAETERRANQLGITDRVEVSRMDACDLQDTEVFNTVQWSQFFFPDASREIVLRAIHRALKPGGYLLMPWLGSVSQDTAPRRGEMLKMALRALSSGGLSFLPFLLDFLGDTSKRRKKEGRYAAIQRLLFGRWGVPVRSVRELKSEVERSGLTVIRSTRLPTSQFVLTRGFLLAQRGST